MYIEVSLTSIAIPDSVTSIGLFVITLKSPLPTTPFTVQTVFSQNKSIKIRHFTDVFHSDVSDLLFFAL